MGLNPCPFCGSPIVLVSDDKRRTGFATSWWVSCDDCGARGPVFSEGEMDEAACVQLAAEAWNRRASK